MSILYGARDNADPPLNPERLALSMIDIQIRRRRDPWPERVMRLLERWFWTVLLVMLSVYLGAYAILKHFPIGGQ